MGMRQGTKAFRVCQPKLGASLGLVVQTHRERNLCWERNSYKRKLCLLFWMFWGGVKIDGGGAGVLIGAHVKSGTFGVM